MEKTIAVIFGGTSNENEISVITGTMAANVLKEAGHKVIPLYIAQNGHIYTGQLTDIANFKSEGYLGEPRAVLANGGIYTLNKRGKFKKFEKVDVVLNCCHGGVAEGGAVCGMCAAADLPLASAGVFESALFMDKYLTKLILSALDVKTLDYVYIKPGKTDDMCGDMPDFPLIIKPVHLGSSIGVEKVSNADELNIALESAFIYDSAIIAESYVEKRREINCAAYYYRGEVKTSECEEAVTDGDILSFEDKYTGGGKSVLPADIPADISGLIKETTRYVYSKLDMRGIVRFDYILSGSEVYLSEVNTVPGSLSYYLLSSGFKDFARVLNEVIEQAQIDYIELKSKKLIKTGILENISSNTCKTGCK